MKLGEIISKYGVPDPKIVGKLPKAGMSLDFVGHADVTKALCEIDEAWSMEPVAFDANGLPAYRVENGMAHMAAWMTIHGVRRLGIGSVMHNKPDLFKELQSDAIRNCAMRFGIYLSLWTKSEWEDVSYTPATPLAKSAAPAPKPAPVASTNPLVSADNIERFKGACAEVALDWREIANSAGVNLDNLHESDMDLLRAAYTKAKATPKPVVKAEIVDSFQINPNEQILDVGDVLAKVVDLFAGAEVIEESRSNHPANGTPQIKEPGAPATPPQLGKLRALCNGAGISSKEDQLSMATDHTKRTITSFNDLTKKEASELIGILAP
jgi:hypothetical protein